MSKLDTATRMMDALKRDERQDGEIPRLRMRLNEVTTLLEKIQDEGGISGDVEELSDEVLLSELRRRLSDRHEDEGDGNE